MSIRTTPEIAIAFLAVISAFVGDSEVSVGNVRVRPGLRVNGRLFAMQVKGRLVAKLPAVRVAALVDSGAGIRVHRGTGKPLKQWISIAPGRDDWIDLAREAREYVGREL